MHRIQALHASRPQRVIAGVMLALLVAAGLALAQPPTGARANPAVVDCPTTEAALAADMTNAGFQGTVAFNCQTDTTIPFVTNAITTSSWVTLDASASPGRVILDGGASTRLFDVPAGTTLNLTSVTLQNAQLGIAGSGAALFIPGGSVTITNSTLSGNAAGSGGAIYNSGGTLTIVNSTFSGNSADAQLNGSGDGGAIRNDSGAVTILNSTFNSNYAFANGAAVFNYSTGAVTANNSTFSSNTAGGSGGAIQNGTQAFPTPVITITDSTFSANSGPVGGNAIATFGAGNATVGGTIIADSSGGNCSGPLTDSGYNLEWSGAGNADSCGFSAASHDLTGQDPLLDSSGLASNGGPTATVALLAGSPASDANSCAFTDNKGNAIATDQRGMSRPDAGESTCDIGAYESSFPSAESDLGLANMPANITTSATGATGAVVTYTPPTATDESGDSPAASVGCSPASGATFPVGTTTVTCTATDADDSNSPVSQTFTVTVNPADADLALANVPGTITAYATSPAGAVVTYTSPIAVDENGDNPAPSVGCAPASGVIFPIGNTTVTCTATDNDDSNSPVSKSFTVSVNDTDLTLANIPANITADATSPNGTAVAYTPPTAVDEDAPLPAVTCSPASGATFAIGTTTVICTATDSSDYSASGSFSVTVKGANDQFTDLIALVGTLNGNRGLLTALVTETQFAQSQYNAGHLRAACLAMGGFLFTVHYGAQAHLISAADAATLTTDAQRLMIVMGC